ncbi:MAG TPA: flagellar hook-length control protein FliK, partial [Dongiaceae bacterium]|nr:flagellar hook-length control protein FliK [Dongiaceae bacterium]
MDATQLSLFLTARLQSSSKLTLQLNDDGNGADKVFADLLKQHAAEQSEQERQTELDRQNWRNQPSSYTPSRASAISSAPPTSSSSADSNNRPASNNNATSPASAATAPKATHQAVSQGNGANTNAPRQRNATPSAATEDQGTAASGRKPDKTKDAAGTDDSQAADGQPGLVTADSGASAKPLAASDQGADGENASGNGQNQGQPGQDDGQKQQQADGNTDGTAIATTVEGAILAGLMTGQPVILNTGIGNQATAGGVQAIGTNAGGTGLSEASTTGTQGAVTAQGAIAAAAAQANAAMAGSLSAAGTAASTQAGAAADLAANQGLPQTAGANAAATAGTTNRQSPQDLAATFASMVAKTTSSTTANGDSSRISITKTDSAPQMPKPLVKIDSEHTALSTTAPTGESAGTAPETEAASPETAATFGAGNEASDDGSDDFRSFSSYSPLLAGGSGQAMIGKQVDPLAALRQQLANASVQDQIAVHLQRAAKDSVDKISIQLSPTELGQIHVKMKVDDDKNVTATITVERPATLDLLQRDTKTLERALQEAG